MRFFKPLVIDAGYRTLICWFPFNNKLDKFVARSRSRDKQAFEVDVLVTRWVYSPIYFVDFYCTDWPRGTWYMDILSPLADIPWAVPDHPVP